MHDADVELAALLLGEGDVGAVGAPYRLTIVFTRGERVWRFATVGSGKPYL